MLILGAGYGGLITAVQLQKYMNTNHLNQKLDITLVNKHDYHYFTTWLHAPAAGTKDPEKCSVMIDTLLNKKYVTFIKDTAAKILPGQKSVELESGKKLSYDYLVIALGSEPETFGIPGLKEHSLNIRSIHSVQKIAQHIEGKFTQYKKTPMPELLTFVIGGAGFTGIEFAGELADNIPNLCKKYEINPNDVKIIDVEGAPTVLPGFDPKLSEYAMDILSKKGVIFKVNTFIKECTDRGIILKNGTEIKTKTVIWTGGVRGHHLIEASGFETVRGRVKVDPYLLSPEYEDVFIIGDGSMVMDPETNRPYPPTAQIAIQQGQNLAKNLRALVTGNELKPFEYHPKGTVASLGKGEGIVW